MLEVGATNPAISFEITTTGAPSDIARYFLRLSFALADVLEASRQFQGAKVRRGPAKRDGTAFPAEEQVVLGTVMGVRNTAAVASGRLTTSIDRFILSVPGLPVFDQYLDQVTIERPVEPGVAAFSAWCELVDIAASDQLRLAGGGDVLEGGQQYDARIRVRYDARWSTERLAVFDGLEYSVVSVAEDTTRSAKRFQIVGLRRVEG